MKKVVSLLLTLAMVASLFVFPSMATTPAGTAVKTAAEFAAMTADGTYYLANDITISATYAKVFTGTFDGNGKTITTSVPVFSEVAGGTVKNLTVDGTINVSSSNKGAVISITTKSLAGNTVVENVINNANLTCTGCCGGIVGRAYGTTTAASSLTITNCVNNGNITAGGHTGGILGYKDDTTSKKAFTLTITNCVNNGNVSAPGIKTSVGGITGAICTGNDTKDIKATTVITGCTNTGKISGSFSSKSTTNYTGVAGICAVISGKVTISMCRNVGDITATNLMCGGIVSTIRYSYNTITISNCDSLGTVSGNVRTGLIVGCVDSTGINNIKKIENCYYTGTGSVYGGSIAPTVTGTPTASQNTYNLVAGQNEADLKLRTVSSGATSNTVIAIVSSACKAIFKTTTTSSAITAIKTAALAELAPWTEAEAELRDYSSSATDERAIAVVDSYIADIWAETNSSSIAFHLSDAKVAYDFVVKKVEAEAAIREYASSATDQRILDVVSSACAEVWTKETSSDIDQVKTKAFADIDMFNWFVDAANEIRELTSTATDPRIIEAATGYINIFNAGKSGIKEVIDAFKTDYINNLNAMFARLAAENEVKAYAQGSTNEIIVTIVSSAIDEIWSSATSTAVLPTVVQKYKTQIDAFKAAVDAEGAIRAYASGATYQRILDVVSSACAEVWTKSTSSAIEDVKTKAFADIDMYNALIAIADEIRELTSTATDQRILEYASGAIDIINAIGYVEQGPMNNMRTVFINGINARFARLAAENEVKDYANGSTNEVIVAIVSSAIDEIWSSATSTGILPAVVQEYKNQIDAYKATIDAEAAIREYASSATDERILEVVSSACVEIWTKTTSSAIEQFKLDTFATIDLINAKLDACKALNEAAGANDIYRAFANLAGITIWNADTVEKVEAAKKIALDCINLAKAKISATAELKAAAEGTESEFIAETSSTAIADVNEAETVEEVETIKSTALAAIKLEKEKIAAIADVNTEAGEETDERIVNITGNATADINAATDKATVDSLKDDAIAAIKFVKEQIAAVAAVKAEAGESENEEIAEIVSTATYNINNTDSSAVVASEKDEAIEAIKLVKAKIAAEAYINSSAALDTDERIKEVVSKAIADIWAQNKDADIEDVKSAAVAAILLAEDKVEAEEAIIAEAGETPSAEMQQIVENALAEIWAKNTRGDVANAKTLALQAIQNRKAAEAPVTADNTIWYVVVSVVAILGSAVVVKKKFF